MPSAMVSRVGLSHKCSVFSSADVTVLSESITWPFAPPTKAAFLELVTLSYLTMEINSSF